LEVTDLFCEIRKELQVVENELKSVVKTQNQLLTETSTHLLNAGGKRLRPALSLYGATFYNFNLEKVLPLAVALELIHMASLVHDDVVDASLTRRGIPTVKAKWGNSISTHIGSYLFAKSLMLIAKYQDTPLISKVLSDTSVKMCEGEIQQISTTFDIDQSIREYFYRIKRKTALLIAASIQLGAVACGAPASIHLPLRRYGYNVGMAFQVTDDILDLVADQNQLGKPVGSDLRQGIITLPVIYALAKSPDRKRLVEIVNKTGKETCEIKEAISIINDSGAIDYSFEISRKFINRAKGALKTLPDIPSRLTLDRAADFISIRKY
jgi:heptaprenyl diphosphate synthase